MQFDHFDPPGKIDDLGGDAGLHAKWSASMSTQFDIGVASVQAYLNHHGGGTCQFYNPVTHPSAAPDLPLSAADSYRGTGSQKRYGSAGPGQPPQYAQAEAAISPGENRDQDEYLEWFVNSTGGRITSVHFTCEAYDYFEFLGQHCQTGVDSASIRPGSVRRFMRRTCSRPTTPITF